MSTAPSPFMQLHPDHVRLLQEVAALCRGVLAALPRPEPRGDWGRGPGAPVRVSLVARPDTTPEAPAPDPRSRAARRPSAEKREPGARRRHTPESIARDGKRLREWARRAGVPVTRLGAEAGVNGGYVSQVMRGLAGLSEKAETDLVAAVERLRKARSA